MFDFVKKLFRAQKHPNPTDHRPDYPVAAAESPMAAAQRLARETAQIAKQPPERYTPAAAPTWTAVRDQLRAEVAS